MLFLIRKPGTGTVGLLCWPFPFSLTWLLCHPQAELSALSQKAAALPCLLAQSIIKTLYHPCPAAQLWKQINCVAVVQKRAQACNCTKSSCTACVDVPVSVLLCVSFLLWVMSTGFQIWHTLLSWSNFFQWEQLCFWNPLGMLIN